MYHSQDRLLNGLYFKYEWFTNLYAQWGKN